MNTKNRMGLSMWLKMKLLGSLFLLWGVLSFVVLYADEWGCSMGILLVPIGGIERGVIEKLRNDLSTLGS